MDRKRELKKVKSLIKKYYVDGDGNLFNSRNAFEDLMCNIFRGEFFTLDICFDYHCFEVFGTTEEEFQELKNFYNNL